MSRSRTKIVCVLLLACATAFAAWQVAASRHRAAADQASRLAALGVVMQQSKPWRVEQINRWPSDLPAKEIRSVQSFSGLKLLNLQGSKITDAELAYLTQLPHLETLLLGETQITDRGLPTIAKIQSLKELSLEHADVTHVAVRELKRSRPDLNIEVYEASLVGLGHLKPYLPHGTLDEDYELVSLDLLGSDVKDKDLEPLVKCRRLRMLNLSETSVGDAGIKHLAPLSNLEELWLRGTNVTDDSLAIIGQLKHLRALSLAETTISDAGVERLRELPQLEILHLGNTQVTDAGLQALHTLISLQELYVANSLATDEGAAALMTVLPNTKIVVDRAAAGSAKDIESKVLG